MPLSSMRISWWRYWITCIAVCLVLSCSTVRKTGSKRWEKSMVVDQKSWAQIREICGTGVRSTHWNHNSSDSSTISQHQNCLSRHRFKQIFTEKKGFIIIILLLLWSVNTHIVTLFYDTILRRQTSQVQMDSHWKKGSYYFYHGQSILIEWLSHLSDSIDWYCKHEIVQTLYFQSINNF